MSRYWRPMTPARTRYPATAFPFSDDLCAFMDAHPAFEKSLKVAKPARFDLIPIAITSHLPHGYARSADEVIGFWYLDKKWLLEGKPIQFKQDIVVNEGGIGKVFYSYAFKDIVKEANSKFVLLAQEFYDYYLSFPATLFAPLGNGSSCRPRTAGSRFRARVVSTGHRRAVQLKIVPMDWNCATESLRRSVIACQMHRYRSTRRRRLAAWFPRRSASTCEIRRAIP